jgi:uncharacterized protein DUF4157
MSLERWIRGDDEAAAFDWRRPARELDVPLDIARALHRQAMRNATDPRRVETLFLAWLRAAAAARAAEAAPPPPGRRTQVLHGRDRSRTPQTEELRRLDPGKWTRVLLDAERAAEAADGAADTATTGATAEPTPDASRGLPAYDDVRRAVGALSGFGRTSPGAAVPADLATRLAPHVGARAAGAARLHTDDAAARVAEAHDARALTVGADIFFGRGEYRPGTERGDELLAHELTHVAQGQRGELHRAAAKGITGGTQLDPSEAEADLRARLAVIDLHAPPGAAPPLAAPSGQPTSDGDRQARLAAQQQRLGVAGQPDAAVADAPPPPASAAQAPVPHQPPAMQPAPRPAPTGNAYVDAFNAPPSKQAMELWGKAGTQATTQAAADQARFDAALPPMPVQLEGGEANAGKGAGPTGKAPAQPPSAGTPPPAAQPAPTPPAPPVTAGAAAAQSFQPSADKAQLKADGQRVLDDLPTTAPDVKTDPGPAPVTDLAGQADPVRTVGDHQHAIGETARALDTAKQKVISGPGAAAVQPVKLDEKLSVPREQAAGAMPQLPAVDGMARMKKWNLPSNALAGFDTVARPQMDTSLAQGKAKMTEADHKRDADRSKAVSDAQDKVKAAHADADKQQQGKVADARTQISNHQADTLVKHEAEIKKLDQQSGTRKSAALGKVNDRIAADQAKVQSDYQDAQHKAEDQKKQGEEDARKKKEEAEHKKKDESWWDRAADAVCDGIKAIADEIDHALEAIGKAIGQILDAVKDAACKVIDAARDFVCQALTEFGDWLKSAVDALIGSVFPELAAALDRMIDSAVNAAKAAVNAIADGLKQAVTALCDGLKGAIDGIIAAFRAAVQAAATFAQALVTGDWSKVGKMILEGILKLLGIDPAAFYALIGKAEDSIEKIIENPGAFVGHLVDAVKLGFQQFGANFWTHLKDGLVQWLFGTFASAGIHMPASFDIAGIFDLVCQVLGLTWPRLRGKVVKIIGEKNTERLEFVARYVQSLVTGGFAGLWQQIQQDMSGLWDMVVNGVKDWILQKVVQQAIIKIATMWNPAGAIIQLIETAWNVYQWVRENAQRIFGLVQAVVDSISSIVAGNIGGAANFIEASLAKLVPIAISLFADLIGLGGIADKIRGIIEKVQDKVDQAIDKLIARVMAMFKGKGGKDGKDDKDGDHKDGQIGARVAFSAHAETHTQYIDAKGGAPVAMVASTPRPVKEVIADWRGRIQKLSPEDKERVEQLIAKASEIEGQVSELAAATKPGEQNAELEARQHELAGTLHTAWEAVFPDAAEFAKRFKVAPPPDSGTRVQPSSRSNVHMDPPVRPPMLAPDERFPGYVVAMASTPREVSADMATRFSGQRNSAWEGSPLKALAKLRTAVVVGINSFRSIDPKKQETDTGKVDAAIGKVRYPAHTVMAVFGFAWEPQWTDGGAAATVDSVRTEWQALPDDQREAARQKTEATVTAQDNLPYGMIRNQVVDTYGNQAASALASAWDPVHILVQDADGGTQAESGLGVLAAYDDVLKDIERHPLMVVGGYRFKGFNWADEANSRTRQLTELANEIDRAIRAAIAKIAPEGLYPTEPNLLIKGIDQQNGDGIYDRGVTGVFGVKKAEGRTARANIVKANAQSSNPHPEPIRSEPSTSIVTSPMPTSRARGLTVFDDTVPDASSGKMYSDVSGTTDPDAIAANSHPAVALEMQRQSYLNPRTLEREVGSGIGLRDPRLTDGIYQQVANTGRTLSDPHLTPEQQQAQIAEHQEAVEGSAATLSQRPRYGQPKNHENLEKTRQIAQAIISAMNGEELKATWEQLRQLFQEIENENRPQQP